MPAPFIIVSFLMTPVLAGAPMTDLPAMDPLLSLAPSSTLTEAAVGAADLPTIPPLLPEDPLAGPVAGISVDLECLSYPDGFVGDCEVVRETHPGLGFGEAAVALMDGARLDSPVSPYNAAPVKFRHTIKFTPD